MPGNYKKKISSETVVLKEKISILLFNKETNSQEIAKIKTLLEKKTTPNTVSALEVEACLHAPDFSDAPIEAISFFIWGKSYRAAAFMNGSLENGDKKSHGDTLLGQVRGLFLDRENQFLTQLSRLNQRALALTLTDMAYILLPIAEAKLLAKPLLLLAEDQRRLSSEFKLLKPQSNRQMSNRAPDESAGVNLPPSYSSHGFNCSDVEADCIEYSDAVRNALDDEKRLDEVVRVVERIKIKADVEAYVSPASDSLSLLEAHCERMYEEHTRIRALPDCTRVNAELLLNLESVLDAIMSWTRNEHSNSLDRLMQDSEKLSYRVEAPAPDSKCAIQ